MLTQYTSIKFTFLYIYLTLLLLLGNSCSKQLDIPPPTTSVSSARVYSSDGNAIAALTGIYVNIQPIFSGSRNGITIFSGLSADELTLFDGVSAADPLASFYINNILVNSTAASTQNYLWGSLYNYIYNCNAAITGLTGATALTPAIKQQLSGEALFMRAFCYYYLVTLYGDVPLILGTDYKTNALQPRTPALQIWQQLVTDLDSAQHLLNSEYLDATLHNGTIERVRPTRGAAAALLSRVYLYLKDWKNAEAQANILIDNNNLYGIDTLNGVFLSNSKESIWQLQPVNAGWNTLDAQVFIIPSTGLEAYNYSFYLNSALLASFETGDQRKTNWVDSISINGTTYFYPYKYKSATYGNPVTEYQMMLRLGEQYLIRAEAKAQQNNISGAKADLNVIRNRAGLPNIAVNTQTALLTAILHERQIELFTELGQRWLDLKRTGTADAVMGRETPLKSHGAPWRSYQQLYPIPLTDLLANPKLTQNPGY